MGSLHEAADVEDQQWLMQDLEAELSSTHIEGPPPRLRLSRCALAIAGVCACATAALLCQPGVVRSEAVNVLGLQKKYEHLDAWLFNGQPPQGGAAVSAEVPQAPEEDMHDGNICADDEEYFEKLCYLKCSLATKGSHPIRTSAFTCCKSEPCGFDNTEINMSPCDGFDVSGSVHGQHGACPHAEGTCLEDEELLLGMCYKKCSILTDGKFNHRVAATTCCSETGLSCLNPMNLRTDFIRFPVGGGKGDGNEETPAVPHLPMKELTEKSPTQVEATIQAAA